MPKSYVFSDDQTANRSGVSRYLPRFILRHKLFAALAGASIIIIAAAPVAGQAISDIINPVPREPGVSERADSAAAPQADRSNGQDVQSADRIEGEESNKPMGSDIRVEAKNSSDSQSSSNSKVDVTVNGQKIPVPENGVVHKKITGNHGDSVVDVRVEGDSTGSSSSSVVIEHHSSSSNNDETGGSRNLNRR